MTPSSYDPAGLSAVAGSYVAVAGADAVAGQLSVVAGPCAAGSTASDSPQSPLGKTLKTAAGERSPL